MAYMKVHGTIFLKDGKTKNGNRQTIAGFFYLELEVEKGTRYSHTVNDKGSHVE